MKILYGHEAEKKSMYKLQYRDKNTVEKKLSTWLRKRSSSSHMEGNTKAPKAY